MELEMELMLTYETQRKKGGLLHQTEEYSCPEEGHELQLQFKGRHSIVSYLRKSI